MTTNEDTKIDSLAISSDFSQIISDTTLTLFFSYWEWGPPVLALKLSPLHLHYITFTFAKLNQKMSTLCDMNVWFEIIKMLMLNWSTVQSNFSIGRNHFRVKIFIIRILYLIKLSSTHFIILSLTKPSWAMTKIYYGLMIKFRPIERTITGISGSVVFQIART